MALLAGGGYAEQVVTHHGMAVHIPDNLDFMQAGSMPEVFLTAYDALFNHCDLKMGEKVLIHAVGSGVECTGVTAFAHSDDLTYAIERLGGCDTDRLVQID